MATAKSLLSLSLSMVGLAALSPLAHAGHKSSGGGGGVLSQNVSAVSHATQSSGSGGSGSQSSSDNSSDDDSTYDSSPTYTSSGSGYVTGVGYGVAPAFVTNPYPTYTRGPELSLYLGLQNVKDADDSEASTAAASLSVRASVDDFGIGLSDSIYYETAPGMEPISMQLWSLNGLFRIARMGPSDQTAVWLTGGFAGLQSPDQFQLYGAGLGAEIAHNFGDAAGVEGSARIIALQEGMRAVEYRVGVAASVIRLSYRYLNLNVDAPALKGPELGVALHF